MEGDTIQYKEGYKYQLHTPYKVEVGIRLPDRVETPYLALEGGILYIREGYAWDGASGPTLDTSSSMRGSLVHDALYQLMRLGLVPLTHRLRADRLLYEMCREDGMWWIRANLWEKAVNLFAEDCALPGTDREVCTAP